MANFIELQNLQPRAQLIEADFLDPYGEIYKLHRNAMKCERVGYLGAHKKFHKKLFLLVVQREIEFSSPKSDGCR